MPQYLTETEKALKVKPLPKKKEALPLLVWRIASRENAVPDLGEPAVPDLESGKEHAYDRECHVERVDRLDAVPIAHGMGHEHQEPADDVEALSEREEMPGPFRLASADENLHEGYRDEEGQEDGQPPFLGIDGVRCGREDEEGDHLCAQDEGDCDPVAEYPAEHA